jgi:hypothetical protein
LAIPVGASVVDPIAASVASDHSFYVAGGFQGGVLPAGPGPDAKSIPNEGGTMDAFLLKIGATGDYQWGHAWGGDGTDFALTIASLTDGGVLVGTLTDSTSVDFQPGGGDLRPNEFPSAVSRFGADRSYGGTFTLAVSLEQLSSQPGGFSIAGLWAGGVDFNPRALENDDRNSGEQSAFVSRYSY